MHSTDSAGAECKQPELEPFLEASRAVLKFNGSYFPSPVSYKLEFKVGGQGLQWFGVRWEACRTARFLSWTVPVIGWLPDT